MESGVMVGMAADGGQGVTGIEYDFFDLSCFCLGIAAADSYPINRRQPALPSGDSHSYTKFTMQKLPMSSTSSSLEQYLWYYADPPKPTFAS